MRPRTSHPQAGSEEPPSLGRIDRTVPRDLETVVFKTAAIAVVGITILSDRDGDGTSDASELAAGLVPDDPQDLLLDEDADGIATGTEVLDFSINPERADTDGDGVPDGDEATAGTSPTLKVTDGDDVADNRDNCPLALNGNQADANDDGAVDISDASSILGCLFLGSAALPAPGSTTCGRDPTKDPLVRCEDPDATCP